MGVNISTAELGLELARLGAVGHISDAMSPFVCDEKFGTKYQKEKSEKFRDFVKLPSKKGVSWAADPVREANRRYAEDTMSQKRGSGLVFMNVMEKLTMGAPAETLQARLRGAMEGGIDGITLSAGLHNGTLKLVDDHPRFRDVLFGIIVSSARALKIFLRSASRVDRLPDYIIVEGPLAGGHLGFGLDWANYDLKSIVPEVLQFLESENLSIPVIPAGGIFSGAEAVEYFEMGAAAVQIATRFTISQECGLPTDVKHVYLAAQEEDILVNTISPTGYPMRMLKSSPCLNSNIRPNCEALGYLLDRDGDCQYHHAYERAGVDERGRKLAVTDKMCICFHFMSYNCYTCGHNVYRLKETIERQPNGDFYFPRAEEVYNDYAFESVELERPRRVAAGR